MSDVEFLDFWNRSDWFQVRYRESVSGVNGQSKFCRELRRRAQRLDRRSLTWLVGVFAGVQLDCLSAHLMGHADRARVRSDEQARPDPRVAQCTDGPLHPASVNNHIQPAFGRDFFSPFRDQRDLVRAGRDGDPDHFISAGEFQVEIGLDGRAESRDIGILDVSAILPEVRGDAIHANRLADECRFYRVWLIAAPGLPERGDVVDVYVKALIACSHIRPEYNFMTMKKLLLAFVVAGAVACHTAPPATTSGVDNTPGAKTSIAAVDRFFAAVHAQDLQAMSLVWGTSKGAARDNMDRTELEKREVILQCYFNSDTFRVTGESPISDIRRMVRVELQRGGRTRTPVVYTVMGPGGRWFVENLDIAAVKDFCAMAPLSPGNR